MLLMNDPHIVLVKSSSSSLAYYWGKVKAITSDRDGQTNYAIEFWDGDITEKVTSKHFHRYAEAIELMKRKFIDSLPLPKDYKDEIDRLQGKESISMNDLHSMRCGVCNQCNRRAACGRCHSCLQSNSKICFQTMCSNIGHEIKGQSSRFLPEGWKFYFEDKNLNPGCKGLFLYRKKGYGKHYRSFAAARATPFSSAFQDYTKEAFYEHVGVTGRAKSVQKTQNILAVKPKDCRQCLPSLKELKDKGCMDCPPCHREPCGRCDPCTNGGDLCLKKVCHRVSHAYFLFSF